MRQLAPARNAILAKWNSATFQGRFGNAAVAPLHHILVPNDSLRLSAFVDPSKIEFKCSFGVGLGWSHRLFQDDEWISRRRPLEDIVSSDMRYITCREIIEEGRPVEETTEFRELLGRIGKRGKVRGRFTSTSDVRSYLLKIAEMYRQVQREGRLRSAEELGYGRHGGDILCAIGDDGRLMMSSSGNHRFAIARLLGTRAPVRIGGIHAALIPQISRHYASLGGGSAIVNAFLEDVKKRYA